MFIMDEVQRKTSMAPWISHHSRPNIQKPISSFARLNGMMTSPISMSATAREAMNQFWMLRDRSSRKARLKHGIFQLLLPVVKTAFLLFLNIFE